MHIPTLLSPLLSLPIIISMLLEILSLLFIAIICPTPEYFAYIFTSYILVKIVRQVSAAAASTAAIYCVYTSYAICIEISNRSISCNLHSPVIPLQIAYKNSGYKVVYPPL